MAGTNNTPFTPDADIVAQVTGTGRPTPGFNGSSSLGSGFTPVYAASIDVGPFLQKSRFISLVTTSGVGNATITTSYIPPAGCQINIQVLNDGSGARTITFGTGFRAASTLVGTISKLGVVEFVCDGTTFNESGRATGIT